MAGESGVGVVVLVHMEEVDMSAGDSCVFSSRDATVVECEVILQLTGVSGWRRVSGVILTGL